MAQACVAGWGKHDYNLTYADEEKNQQVFWHPLNLMRTVQTGFSFPLTLPLA